MKNFFKARFAPVIGAIALMAVVGFSMAACGGDGGGPLPPELKSEAERWAWKWDEQSTAKIGYSVDAAGVCTITVSGKTDWIGSAHVAYEYTYKEGANFIYTLEAWTQTGERNLVVNYFEDYKNDLWLSETISITTTPKTYTIYGDTIPKPDPEQSPAIRFQCADQLGTFYIKIKEIKEYTIGKLTITNFSDTLGNNTNYTGKYLIGYAHKTPGPFGIDLVFGSKIDRFRDGDEIVMISYPKEIKINSNSVNIPVWEVDNTKKTFAPFKGNIEIPADELGLSYQQVSDEGYIIKDYLNKVPITFTNGNASINLGTQMEHSASSEGTF